MDCRNVRHWRLQSRSGLRASAGWPPNASAPARVPQACQDASHIGKAADNARHRIVGMNLILQIDEALVPYRAKSLKNPLHGHDAVSHRHLAILALKVCEVLHVYVKQPRARRVDRLNHIRAGAHRVPDVDTGADARVHPFHRLQYIQRRMPQLIFWPVIVDGETDVVLLHELLDPRQSLRRGVAGDDDGNTCPLAIFELAADVRVFILREIDGSGSVKLDARRGIVRQRSCLFLRIRRQMILDVLGIQLQHVQLLQEVNHLCTAEVAKRVAGQAQTNRRSVRSRWPSRNQCEDFVRSSERRQNYCAVANESAAGKDIFDLQFITRLAPLHLRHAAPSLSRTRAPTSSSLPGRPESARLSYRHATPGSLPTQCSKAAAS